MSKRRTHPYTSVNAIIFDVDNTLYKLDQPLRESATAAFCKAVRTHLGKTVNELDDGYISLLGHRSLKESGDASTLFSQMPGASHRDLHQLHHQAWEDHHIAPNPALVRSLKDLKEKGLKFYAYSDAHQDWTWRALSQLGLFSIFEGKDILTRDQLSCFSIKRGSDAGYRHLHAKSGLEPHQIVMVDDSEANLEHAKKLGFVTVLIKHGKEPRSQPPTYDFSYETVDQFIADFNKRRTQKPHPDKQEKEVYSGR